MALSGHGEQLMVASHLGLAIPGNQAIGLAIFNVFNKRKHLSPQYQILPLAPKYAN